MQFTKWEENKKLQRVADKLRLRLKEKQEEIDKFSRSNDLLKAAVERNSVRRRNAEDLAKRQQLQPTAVPTITEPLVNGLLSTLPAKEIHQLVELQEKNFMLEQEVSGK